jgi:uncharacterized protein YktA (UPF0223 family)
LLELDPNQKLRSAESQIISIVVQFFSEALSVVIEKGISSKNLLSSSNLFHSIFTSDFIQSFIVINFKLSHKAAAAYLQIHFCH